MTMTSTAGEITPRQQSYIRKLRDQAGEDAYRDATQAVFGVNWAGTGAAVPSTVTKAQASTLIELLQSAAGVEARPYQPRARRYGGRRYYTSSRCTHEDYPCCGCER